MNRLKIALAAALFLGVTLFGHQGLWRLIKLRQITRSLEQETRQLLVQNAALAQEIQRLAQPEYLERLIRQERGYIREGEILVEIPNPLDSQAEP